MEPDAPPEGEPPPAGETLDAEPAPAGEPEPAPERAPVSRLVAVPRYGGGTVRLWDEAAAALAELQAAARAAGFAAPLFLPVSGYRTNATQQAIFATAVKRYGAAEAPRWVARPGSSEHQTGLAVDLFLGLNNNSSNVAALRALPAYRWLVENAAAFKFFPYKAEPWHWKWGSPHDPTGKAAAAARAAGIAAGWLPSD